MSRAAETAASSILFNNSGDSGAARFSVMVASFHIADCRSQARPARFGRLLFSRSHRLLELSDFAGRKEVCFQRFIEFRGITANPLERHGKMFDFFIHV